MVGGNFEGDNVTTEENAAFTRDGGLTWTSIPEDKNPGEMSFDG